jgi:GNAT superfamily N-acetyltransferase
MSGTHHQDVPIRIEAATADDIPEIAAMLREYAAWLAVDLSFQGFDREVAQLPGDYAPPAGALLVAWLGERPVGMVALRRRDHERGEMKRLFVRPSARAAGVGRRLVERVIQEARDRGYQQLLLDTLPVMSSAHALLLLTGVGHPVSRSRLVAELAVTARLTRSPRRVLSYSAVTESRCG